MRRNAPADIARIGVAAAALVGAMTAGAHAAPQYDIAFVSEFAEACVPGRLGYDTTQASAVAAGWSEVTADAHPELADLMAASLREAADPELQASFEYTAYQKAIDGRPHFLVVSLSSAVLDDPADPWVNVGCYLYDFDAKGPIDPAPVTALTGNPIAHSVEEQGVATYVWGPPCLMPRTGDTYLTYVAETGSDLVETSFTGLALKFSTSVPDPGEIVPTTYC